VVQKPFHTSSENRDQRVSSQRISEKAKRRKITYVAKSARTSGRAQAIIFICGGVPQEHVNSFENRDQRSAVSESAKKRKGEKSLMWQRVRELQAALRPLFSFLDGVRQHMASPSKIGEKANQRKS